MRDHNEPKATIPTRPKEIEIARLRQLPEIPDTLPSGEIVPGVLLSERIKHFVTKYNMIHPFDEDHLKPASYELSVGDSYAKGEKISQLNPGEVIKIEPFNVVVIQTLETLNLPRFLIARWNLRIKWAYKGLLWVGAPQVDPGFKGFLACPLYNLSNKEVEISHGEPIAAMDFVTTTPVTTASKRYDWSGRTRIVLADYEKDRLESALYTDAARKLVEFGKVTQDLRVEVDEFGRRVEGIGGRVDSFTVLTFTIVAVLFAALGVAFSRSSQTSFWGSGAPLAAISLWFSLRAFYLSRSRHGSGKTLLWLEIVLGVLIAVGIGIGEYKTSGHAAVEIREARDTASEAQHGVADLKRDLAARQDLQKRIDSLQTQIDALKTKR